jgi:uncharacterized protein
MSQRGGTSLQPVSGAVIDSLEFARAAGRFEGRVAVAEFDRLAELIGNSSGALDCTVLGERDSEGQSYLVVRVAGELELRCQRCLKSLFWSVSLSSRLLLVAPNTDWPDDDLAEDECDAIGAEKALPLLPLLEDEVILALPLSPRHEMCDPPVPDGEDRESSPFAALAKLKKS